MATRRTRARRLPDLRHTVTAALLAAQAADKLAELAAAAADGRETGGILLGTDHGLAWPVIVRHCGDPGPDAIRRPAYFRRDLSHAAAVAAEHRRGLRVQELPPGRVSVPFGCRGDLQGFDDPADGGCADPVAELEQLALDPLVSPGVVLGGQPLDEGGDLGADRRPSCPVRVGPLAGDQAAVPPQDGAGGDQPVRSQPCWQEPDQRGEDRAVGPVQPGPRVVRRSTATSCRSTSNSAFLKADDRPSKTSQPQTRTKMR